MKHQKIKTTYQQHPKRQRSKLYSNKHIKNLSLFNGHSGNVYNVKSVLEINDDRDAPNLVTPS